MVPGFAWGLEWYFFAEIGSGNGFGKDKKKEPKVVLCLRKLSSVPFFEICNTSVTNVIKMKFLNILY